MSIFESYRANLNVHMQFWIFRCPRDFVASKCIITYYIKQKHTRKREELGKFKFPCWPAGELRDIENLSATIGVYWKFRIMKF
jgi:hypothetical protein